MAAIRGTDTKPELIIRRKLFARGFRYRLHDRKLPGRPDLVLPKHRAVIFVNGCFWHGHDCALFQWPKSREDFWRAKIGGNVDRDHRNVEALRLSGWRVCVVWECALKGKHRLDADDILDGLSDWLRGSESEWIVRGRD